MDREKKQAVFFDIDGTLWNFDNEIPPSAVEAIRALRSRGHLAFLCSGRTHGYIRDPALLGIGFDGIISGCGTVLEYKGETLFRFNFDRDAAVKIVTTVRRHGFKPILEGQKHLYLDPEDFEGDMYGAKLTRELGDALWTIRDHWGEWEFSKISCDTRGCDQAAAFAELPELDPISHNPYVVEMIPRGYGKGVGIEKLCAMIGHDMADTVAFGDGRNDLGMFAVCGESVCMGNGTPDAKAAAGYVTTELENDGVWNACKHLGLI